MCACVGGGGVSMHIVIVKYLAFVFERFLPQCIMKLLMFYRKMY